MISLTGPDIKMILDLHIHTHAEKTESTESFAYFADVVE